MYGLIVLVPPRYDPYEPPDPYADTDTDTDTDGQVGAEGQGEGGGDGATDLAIAPDSMAALEAAGVRVVAVPWLDVSPGGECAGMGTGMEVSVMGMATICTCSTGGMGIGDGSSLTLTVQYSVLYPTLPYRYLDPSPSTLPPRPSLLP